MIIPYRMITPDRIAAAAYVLTALLLPPLHCVLQAVAASGLLLDEIAAQSVVP